MARPGRFGVLLAAAAMAIAVRRHGRAHATGGQVPGGTLVGDAVVYDALSRLALGGLYTRIAADVAALAPDRGQVLEVGCGPGHLAIRLAGRYGLDVTGLDLDPSMIERARARAETAGRGDHGRPAFRVGDVAALPFPDRSVDLVVSTLSVHHWADPSAGLAEIARVLRPGSRALIWDFRPGAGRFHGRASDPVEHTPGSPLRLVDATPWTWPWRFRLLQRTELILAEDGGVKSGPS